MFDALPSIHDIQHRQEGLFSYNVMISAKQENILRLPGNEILYLFIY